MKDYDFLSSTLLDCSAVRRFQWLSPNDIVMVEEQVKILFNLGYYWDDMFVQCVLSIMLDDIGNGG